MLKNGHHLNIQAEVGDITGGQFERDQTSTPLTEETGVSEQNGTGHSRIESSRLLSEEQGEHTQSSLASSTGAEMDMHGSQVGILSYMISDEKRETYSIEI